MKNNSIPNSSNIIFLKPERSVYFINFQSFKENLIKTYGYDPAYLKKTYHQPENNMDNQAITDFSANDIASTINAPHLILDFSAVNYIDTVAIKVLIEVKSFFFFFF